MRLLTRKGLGKKTAIATAAFGLVGMAIPTSQAVSASSLFFSINASDSASYSSSAPTAWNDLSTSARNGTIIHGPLTYDAANGALSFSNSGLRSDSVLAKYVDMGSGFSNFGSGITLEFEAHFGSSGSLNWNRIFDFGNGAEHDNIWVGNYASTDEIALELWTPEPTTQVGYGRCRTADSVNAITVSTFKKYVITLDGSTCHIYINGVEVNTVVDGYAKLAAGGGNSSFDNFYDNPSALGSTYVKLPNNTTRANNYIGRSNWVQDSAFNGSIKYVRIYTEALTSSDVANNATTYTLTYSTSGSESGTAPANRTGNGLVSLDSNSGSLTKAGHTFAGWATSANQSTAISGSYNLTANATLYPAFAPNTYTVTYDTHGGNSISNGSFTHGGSLTFPANPTQTGYEFQGWFAAASGGSALSASAVAAGNASTTLHAQWTLNSYTVIYDSHGGSSVANGTFTHGGSLTYPTNPTRAGYTFQGWFANSSGGSALTASSVSAANSSTTLHAQWIANPAQTVSWSPTNTSINADQSPVTPSTSATTSGDGAISYSVASAGSTGCTVNSSSGVLSFSGVGKCVVQAKAAATSNYAEATRLVEFTIGSVASAISLNLDLATGATVTNADVSYGAAGLQSGTTWSLVVKSTPQTIATGTSSGSVISGTAQIPAGLSAGWHSITFTGVNTSGATISHAIFFEVSTTGTLAQTTSVNPESSATTSSSSNSKLASTGMAHQPIYIALLALVFGGLLITLRRTN